MLYVTISGSFRKHLSEIKKIISEFKENGVTVLSPKISKVQDSMSDFIYFETDKNKPVKILEQAHLFNIAQSDFLYVVNPKGYMGNSTLLEIGYALAKKKKIFSSQPPFDTFLKNIMISGLSIPKIINTITVNNTKLDNKQNLSDLQNFMLKKTIERGFDDEDEKDILILLLEEIGELARIIRKYSGLKMKKESLEEDSQNIEDELADVFIYTLILANKFGIDLYESFKSKELKNDKRIWVRQ